MRTGYVREWRETTGLQEGVPVSHSGMDLGSEDSATRLSLGEANDLLVRAKHYFPNPAQLKVVESGSLFMICATR